MNEINSSTFELLNILNYARTERTSNDMGKEELAYKKLCEFEKNYCENIFKNYSGSIIYEINEMRLAELEVLSENNLKDPDFFTNYSDLATEKFPSYKKLFEAKYKNRFLKNILAINPNELQKKIGKELLETAIKQDFELKVRYLESIKEVDLDNDGTPDRIDIDDTKNSVQTVADLHIVKNTTSKDTNRDHEKTRERQKNNIEL